MRWILFWFLIFSTTSFADSPAWIVLDKVPYLTLEDWAKRAKFQVYPDIASGRILLERKDSAPVLLLLHSPYALQGGRFIALSEAPRLHGGKILLSLGGADLIFPGAMPKAEQDRLRNALADIKKTPVEKACLQDRPVRRIFLDPGHGGEDAGTKFGTTLEKTIVLKFAQLAAEELRKQGFEVSFSRTRDVFLPLEIRPKLAKEWKADLFVSIHVNSSPVSLAQGTETYILSQDATDAEARKLALIENSIASESSSRESAVQDILWDMEQTAYLQDSAYLASYLQEALVSHAHELVRHKHDLGGWKNRGVRQAPFYVLNRAAMPAVLVEIGYLSNRRDRNLMLDKNFQESLAKALAEGVKKYRDACRSSS